MTKRPIAALLAALLALSLAACQKGGLDIPANQTVSQDFQKNLHQADRTTFVETDTGYYMAYGWLFYMEKGTFKTTIVCSKPDCDHQDENVCNGIINGYLIAGGDDLYFVTNKYENGKPNKLVHAIKLDATERKTVQSLKCNEFSSSDSSSDRGIYHRGYFYYISDDIIYRVKLGGEKDSAQEVYRPENAGSTQAHQGPGGMYIEDYNPNPIRYTLWADGDTLYFMTNVETEDGTYKDALFRCGLDGSDVRMVWITPDKEDVGEWEETGVSVSQWYVEDGYIYFYLAMNGLWKTEIATGKTERLADTTEKVPYGSAIFSDEYICLLNDYPVFFYGFTEPEPGGIFRYYGNTLFIYRKDGTFVKEIPLEGLYQDPAAMAEIDLLFCTDSDVFFRTTSMSTSSLGGGLSGLQGNQGDVNLCRANIETGEVQVICTLKKGQ